MKNKFVAGLVLATLTPIAASAAPISWISEQYNIYADLEVGHIAFVNGRDRAIADSQSNYDVTKTSANDLPFTFSDQVSTPETPTSNRTAFADLAIRDLSNSNANIYEFSNKIMTRSNEASNSNLYAYADSGAAMTNSFIANTNSLYVTYDYNSVINMAASSSDLSYHDLNTYFTLIDTTDFRLNQTRPLILNDYADNSGIQGPHYATNAGITYTLADNGSYVFSGLTLGRKYTLYTTIDADMYSSGSIADNSSTSLIRVSFSDSPLTAVPEPETYAMLLSGLALVGFSARRKQQA